MGRDFVRLCAVLGIAAPVGACVGGEPVVVLEAAATSGGRVRRTLDFVDFPIPLGAEWLHVHPDLLSDIAGDDVGVELVGYGTEDTLGYFDGAASRAYRRHVSQDWSAEPFVRQAYVADEADWQLVRTLGEAADVRVQFAGDAYTDGEDWSSVHTAVESARAAVTRLLRDV